MVEPKQTDEVSPNLRNTPTNPQRQRNVAATEGYVDVELSKTTQKSVLGL